MSFAENMGKNIDKNISENLSRKYSQKLLDHTKTSSADVFKTISKRSIQKTVRAATVDSMITKLLIKSGKFKKTHNKIIQKQLQMSMIRKYQNKDIYLLKKGKKILMN